MRISEDLNGLGVETFLDAKDITTGESIDASIQAHIKDSDEILMLLSPDALKSDWVLIEIGGAKALDRRLVPILLHVGVNDLPAAINDGLARDLNEIDAYYEELKIRINNGTPTEANPAAQRRQTQAARRLRARPKPEIPVETFVKIPEYPQKPFQTDAGALVNWTEDMNAHAGKIAKVLFVDDDRTVQLDVDDQEDWWAMDWLEVVDPHRG